MKKNSLLFIVAILLFLSCTNKKSDPILPKPTGISNPSSPSNINLRTGTLSDSIWGNYPNPNNPTPNKHNEFFIRCYPYGAPRPLIITFHGGFFKYGDKKQFDLPLNIGPVFKDLITVKYLENNGFAYAGANYRVLGNAADPSDDNLRIKDCLNDCKAFVEYMRDNAVKYNIDPNKIIVMGYSAGASASLWLGLQNGAISGITIKGIVALNTQSTLNITEWGTNVFSVNAPSTGDYNNFYNSSTGKEFLINSSLDYYGTTNVFEIYHNSKINNLSLYNLIDSNDPELYMATDATTDAYGNADIAHHYAHDLTLINRSIVEGHRAKILYTARPLYVNPNFESVMQFCVRIFQ
ncbi:alpha/beta hydrolase [Cytophaga aurantiaca]|uniref:alpha/beta hydrolase n=1 Tax=Cytophaga aurantiaca TaxID=29530 RepID=UPI0003641C68|nr:alpha/beta hydrolase [Cytophaga aurantiaca]